MESTLIFILSQAPHISLLSLHHEINVNIVTRWSQQNLLKSLVTINFGEKLYEVDGFLSFFYKKKTEHFMQFGMQKIKL